MTSKMTRPGKSAMRRCYNCQKELEIEDKVDQNDICPYCQAGLHCCFNCRFYSPGTLQQCNIPDMEEIKNKKQANACQKFLFREFFSQYKESPPETAKEKIDDLFRNL